MERIKTKQGDVFSVKLDENTKKYFQYIAKDSTQLNSDVIRAFKKAYPLNGTPDIHEVIKEEVEFYAHCFTKWGIKLGYWEKVGNIADTGKIEVLFRDTNDAGSKPGEQIKISQKWYVWKINDQNFTRVGRLEGEKRKAEIGIVISPDNIVHRMRTGEYNFFYPGYE